MKNEIKEIQEAEEVARVDRITEMEAERASNIIKHADEINARGPKVWFQSKAEKDATQKETLEKARSDRLISKMGDGKHRLTRKKKRRMELRAEQEQMKEEYRLEQLSSGNDQKKRLDENTMKATARAKKIIDDRKRDVDSYQQSISEEFSGNPSKKIRRPQVHDSYGIFDDARTQLSEKKEVAPGGKGKYTFTEYNPNGTGLRKGGKKGSNKFKSKAKHNRRK